MCPPRMMELEPSTPTAFMHLFFCCSFRLLSSVLEASVLPPYAMSKPNRDVELAQLVHDSPLGSQDVSPSHQGLAEQLPNVPSYRVPAASRIPVLVSRKQKAGVTNPSFLKEEASHSRPLGNIACAMALCVAALYVCVFSAFSSLVSWGSFQTTQGLWS